MSTVTTVTQVKTGQESAEQNDKSAGFHIPMSKMRLC